MAHPIPAVGMAARGTTLCWRITMAMPGWCAWRAAIP
jgi:hypothetical protein